MPRVVAAVLVLLASIGSGCSASKGVMGTPEPIASESVLGSNGVESKFGSELTEVTLVHFWASWCSSCVYEMQSLARLSKLTADPRFTVLALAVDDSPQSVAALKLPKTNGMHVAFDHLGNVKTWAKVGSLPTTVVVDRNGKRLSFLDPETKRSTTKVEGMRDWTDQEFIQSVKALVSGS